MIIDIFSAEYRNNPYFIFKYLREAKKVCRTEPFGHWMVGNYLDVQSILKNSNDFCSSHIVAEPEAIKPEFFLHSRGLVGSDPPHHTRLRRTLNKSFTPVAIRTLAHPIRELCQKLIANIRQHKVVDIVNDFAAPLSIMVIADFLGIDKAKHREYKQWIDLLLSWQKQGKTPHVLATATSMFNYFNDIIMVKKSCPGSDLISDLIAASGNKIISDAEVLAMIRLLLLAGTDAMTNLIANGIYFLCKNSEWLTELKNHPSLIKNFIEEILRSDSPVLSLVRRVNTDVAIGKTQIKKGEIVLPLLASANYDESVFSDPEKFDIHRKMRSHFTFGTGRHYCMGSQLARLQAKIAFEELLTAFKKFELDPHSEIEYNNLFFFRGFKKLCLKVTA